MIKFAAGVPRDSGWGNSGTEGRRELKFWVGGAIKEMRCSARKKILISGCASSRNHFSAFFHNFGYGGPRELRFGPWVLYRKWV